MSETIKTTTVARVNNVDIVIIENGEKRVAIKPICKALGIDEEGQRQKLISDPILSSVTLTSKATGADGKSYEMVTIPFKFVFGWLFRIDSRNVKEDARAAVLKYQIECYDALYNHFTGYADFVEQKQQKIEEQLQIEETAKTNFKSAKEILFETQSHLKYLRSLTYESFDPENHQFKLEF